MKAWTAAFIAAHDAGCACVDECGCEETLRAVVGWVDPTNDTLVDLNACLQTLHRALPQHNSTNRALTVIAHTNFARSLPRSTPSPDTPPPSNSSPFYLHNEPLGGALSSSAVSFLHVSGWSWDMEIAELDVESGGQGGESSSPSNTLNEVLDVVGNTRPFHRQEIGRAHV